MNFKTTRYALVAPKSKSLVMDFGSSKDLLQKHIDNYIKTYGVSPNSLPVRITNINVIEDWNSEEVRTEVGVTLLYNTSLVLTSDDNIAIEDRNSGLFVPVGPATESTLDAIIDAAQRLKTHCK